MPLQQLSDPVQNIPVVMLKDPQIQGFVYASCHAAAKHSVRTQHAMRAAHISHLHMQMVQAGLVVAGTDRTMFGWRAFLRS